MKRIISFILTFCMLMGSTTSFAENGNVADTNENIIDSTLLTDENVLYKAMKDKTGFSLLGIGNDEEITADFDVVVGFDMSYSMYEYDVNGDKQWMEDFKAISEQAPDDTRYAVLSSRDERFTDDLESAISAVQGKEYTGTNDIISILDKTLSIFDNESSNRNKVVIATANKIDDVSALKNKMDELNAYGVIPFVFVLNTDTNNALNIDGVYQCATDLELHMAISDLYLAFIEFNMTEAIQTYADDTTTVLSDFREDRHMFNGAEHSAGLQMASMLNMYKCVPLKAGIGTSDNTLICEYDLFNASSYPDNGIDLEGKLRHFAFAENSEFGEVPSNFKSMWDRMFTSIENNKDIVTKNPYVAQAASILKKNMKRRFPVMIKHDDIWEVVYEYKNPISGSVFRYNTDKIVDFSKIQAVFDTYEYLMLTVSKSSNLYEKVTRTSSEITVEIQYPSNYNFVIDNEQNELNTIRREALDGKSGYINFNSKDKTLYVTAQCTGKNTERNFVVGSLVIFSGGFADVYGANKVYYTRYYRDISANDWFHDYVFKATNLEIVAGTDENKFEPDEKVTLAQLFRMIFETAKIDGIDIEGNTTGYWAYPYMLKAKELGLIDIENNLDEMKNIGDMAVNRGQAAKYICQIFYDNRDKVNVPTLLYDNVDNIENYRSNMFEDLGIDKTTDEGKAIYKLYMNGIMNGYTSTDMGVNDDLTRAQICTLLIKCLFDMDEHIPVIMANIEENAEVVPIDIYMTTDERSIKGISFDNNNKAAFNIHIEDDEEYEVEIEGGTETTIQGAMECIVGTGTFTPETSQTGNFVYTIHGPGVFQLNLVRSGIDSINLKITKISAQSQVIPLNQVITQDMINRNTLSFTAEKNGYYIINVTPGTTFNLTDQSGRKVEEYYTELYRGFDSDVPQFITQKMVGVDRELNYIDSNGNTTSRNEVCDCYKYYLEKGAVITMDTIKCNSSYKLQVDAPQDGDIVFMKNHNEYFIYSDSPEAITDNTLADNGDNPYAFIRLEHLGKGKYTFMSWHLNYSSKPVYMDVQLYSENAKIKINAIGINAPTIDEWDGDWVSPQAFLNMNYFECNELYNINDGTYDTRLYGKTKKSYTLNAESGNSMWLKDFYNEEIYNKRSNTDIKMYPQLPAYVGNQIPMYIIFEFEVLEGEVILNQVAYNDRNNIIAIGEDDSPYNYTGAFKGISNTSNEVTTDFSYEIKGEETYIPVRTFNLNNPLGYTSAFWESNVNPQEDKSLDVNINGVEDGSGNRYQYRVRDIATETELLKFIYKDKNKVWYFDEFHDINENTESTWIGDTPNRLITTEVALNRYDNEGEKNKLSMANYSVIETYNIKLKNSSESTKTIEFILDSESNDFIFLKNLQKDPVFLSKGEGSLAQIMYYIVLEPNQEIEYQMKTVLPTANNGSIRNCFKIYEGVKDYGEDKKIVNNLFDGNNDWNY